MQIFLWDTLEAKALLKEIKIIKDKKKPLKVAFVNHADKFLRSSEAVKAFYYKLKTTKFYQDCMKEEQENIVKSLQCSPSKQIEEFSKKNLEKLLHKVYDYKDKGLLNEPFKNTVQISMFKTSSLDTPRNIKKKVADNIEQQSSLKLLQMPDRSAVLSQADLNSLFLGFVSLLKKNVENGFKIELDRLKATVKTKNSKILELLNINSELKNQLQAEQVMAQRASLQSLSNAFKKDEICCFKKPSAIKDSENFKNLKAKFGCNSSKINELRVKLDAYKPLKTKNNNL